MMHNTGHTGEADSPRQKDVLVLSSRQDNILSRAIQGFYIECSTNHGRAVYKKDLWPGDVEVDAYIYYWDERDGARLSGWWLGPVVGGELAWAYHPSRVAMRPPYTDWMVASCLSIDRTFVLLPALSDEEEWEMRRKSFLRVNMGNEAAPRIGEPKW